MTVERNGGEAKGRVKGFKGREERRTEREGKE